MKKILTLTIALIVFASVAFATERVMRFPTGSPTTVLGTDTTASDLPIADAGTIISATEVEGALQENRTALDLNTLKETNVATDLSAGTRTATTIDVNSSDGTNATLVEADTTNAGLLGSDKWDEIVANTNKTTESTTVTSPLVLTTFDIAIPVATNAAAGHASAAHITAIEANTAKDIDDTAYDATSWDTNADAATKNAIRDKIETMGGSGDLLADGTVPLTADWDAGNSSYDITAVEFKGALIGNADTVTNGVYTTDFPLNQDTTGKADTAGNADTVTTITGLAPDTQNTYARTQYLIPYAGTTTSFSEIAIGEDGDVLTSGGVGVAPSFEAGGGGGATTELDNLGTVAINTDLISDTDSTDDLGSTTKYWANAYIDEVYTPAIQFPASQSASADANTLDDYEEGTWTMAMTCKTSGTITLSGGTDGVYTKVGRVINASGRVIVGSTSSPVGEARVSLPFTADTGDNLPMGTAALNGVDINASAVYVTPELPGGVGYFRLAETLDAAALQVVQGGDFGSGDEIRFSITYFTE